MAAAPLQAESREADPRSEKVKLKLWVSPVTAEVFWGAKRLGTAGREPLEIERPRGSGPLDVVVRAPGYLPYHTRLFTDRDDTLTVRLVDARPPRRACWAGSAAHPPSRAPERPVPSWRASCSVRPSDPGGPNGCAGCGVYFRWGRGLPKLFFRNHV